MDVIEKTSLPVYKSSTFRYVNKITKEDLWLPEKQCIKKHKKSKLSISTDNSCSSSSSSSSSSEEDEPITPTHPTPFLNTAAMYVKERNSTCSMQTPNGHEKLNKKPWFHGLFNPKKSITNLFTKKPPPSSSLPSRRSPSPPKNVSLRRSPSPATNVSLRRSPSPSTNVSLRRSSSPATSASSRPFDMERAIYQLSHKKLTDPYRPLQQQVLISNMMYWYLNNKTFHFITYNTVCQATYQSFAPPTPAKYKHQPIATIQKKNNKYKPIKNTMYIIPAM